MQSFNEAGLPLPLLKSLEQMGFTTPTPIQAQAIPPALEGKDILGSAQTGTGKTGAFGIPLVTRLMQSPRGSALVMTPTRELAVQVMDALQQMIGKQSAIKGALLIGGESMPKQLQQLRARPRLIVGTPGRINDHLGRGSLMLADTQFLVLDEMDRMLDMGFTIQIEKIVKFMPVARQTLLFSATLSDTMVKTAQKYLRNPVRVSVGSSHTPIARITQELIHVNDEGKYPLLLKQLEERKGSVIIFMKTKHATERMAERLIKQQISADAIHGDLRQSKRDRVIESFREEKFRVLVATDIAARGLDIPHIQHVINYDLPQAPEDYIHRIGRTGRAGAEGAAVCFISPAERPKWRAIHQLIHPDEKLVMPALEGGESRSGGGGGRGRPAGGGSFGGRNSSGGGNKNGSGFGGGNGGGARPAGGAGGARRRPQGSRPASGGGQARRSGSSS